MTTIPYNLIFNLKRGMQYIPNSFIGTRYVFRNDIHIGMIVNVYPNTNKTLFSYS